MIIVIVIVATIAVLFLRGPASLLADGMMDRLDRWSRRRVAAWGAIAGVSLATCLLTTFFLFRPVPSVADEFAYVLTADTFAAGRLTNPRHPFHEHFASWHVIQEPSYQGKYPPAQGVFLALGELLFRDKLIGVWLSYTAAMLASYWAALAWLPRRWALLATCLLLTNVPMSFAWGNSYWGGAVTLLGGSLLVGGWGQLRNGRSTWWSLSGLAFGLGMGILAASRPFEGALMAFPIGLDSLFQSRRLAWGLMMRFWGTASLGVAVCLVGLLSYHQAVTGNPLKMPYQVWTAQQGEALSRLLTPAMALVKSDATEPDQTSNSVSSVNNAAGSGSDSDGASGGKPTSFASSDWRSAELARWMRVRSDQRLAFTWDKLVKTYAFFLQSVLLLPLLGLPWLLGRQRGLPVMLAAIGLVTIGCCLHLSAGHAHYVAGIASLLVIIIVACLRALYVAHPQLGKPLLATVLFVWLLFAFLEVSGEVVLQPHLVSHAWAKRRQAMQEQLATREEVSRLKQLVFVRYASDHNVHRDWGYNAADIDSAPVIWANALNDRRDQQLIEYYREAFGGCEPWLLTVSEESELLLPFGPVALVK